MKKYTTLLGRLFDAGLNIRKTKLALIKKFFQNKETDTPKYKIVDAIELVEQIQDDLTETKKVLLLVKDLIR